MTAGGTAGFKSCGDGFFSSAIAAGAGAAGFASGGEEPWSCAEAGMSALAGNGARTAFGGGGGSSDDISVFFGLDSEDFDDAAFGALGGASSTGAAASAIVTRLAGLAALTGFGSVASAIWAGLLRAAVARGRCSFTGAPGGDIG